MLGVSWALGGLASLLAILVAVFLLEIIAGILPLRRVTTTVAPGDRKLRPRVAVLIPAHNESAGIRATLDDIRAQIGSSDRLLVVADNCTDRTAVVAAAAGAEVVERHDLTRIGKGYALDHGLQHLRAEPPQIVVFVDADCRLLPGAIERLALASSVTGRPVQALYLMTSPDHGTINYRVAEFAWRARNWIRPLGLSSLGLPCRLTGAGMAFPWDVIRSVELASAEIAEDQKLGPDLTLAGHAPLFCPSAVVTSQFPTSAEGAKTQRQRWEHGPSRPHSDVGPADDRTRNRPRQCRSRCAGARPGGPAAGTAWASPHIGDRCDRLSCSVRRLVRRPDRQRRELRCIRVSGAVELADAWARPPVGRSFAIDRALCLWQAQPVRAFLPAETTLAVGQNRPQLGDFIQGARAREP